MLCSAAVIAVAAVPASARVPAGQGLTSFGFADCGEDLGVVEIFGPPAGPATSGYLIVDEETALQVVATRFELRSAEGEIFFEKNFGTKAGLTKTFTCTQTGDFGDVFTLTAAVVPPH
jgi:hypothetical protein